VRVLDLFSGIGGFSLGLEAAGMETVAFCEFDSHAQQILKKHWPEVPIHDDIKKLDGNQYRGTVDVVCGGFPCQDLSSAGKQAGFDGDRSSLYGQMLRVISECLPRYAVFENVAGLLTGDRGRWFAKFLYDLAAIGYDAEWHCIPASAVGANHRRERVWVVAYPNLCRLKGSSKKQVVRKPRLQIQLERSLERWAERSDIPAPRSLRKANGVSRGLDRITRLGNAVVPQVVEVIGRAIVKYENDRGWAK
jgi:DNA (cytosine-5)-methyltransferase 1